MLGWIERGAILGAAHQKSAMVVRHGVKSLRPVKAAFERVLGWLIVGALAVLRLINRQFMANLIGRLKD